MGHRRLTDSEWVPQVSNRPLGGKCAVGERLTQSGAGVRRHSCMPSLALALLATLGSATAMADPLTCHGWLNANDFAVDNPYNATLIQLMPPDMPKEQVITRFIPELVRECSEHAQLGFTSAVKQVLLALDAPEPQVQEVAPEPPASKVMATEPPTWKQWHPSRQPHHRTQSENPTSQAISRGNQVKVTSSNTTGECTRDQNRTAADDCCPRRPGGRGARPIRTRTAEGRSRAEARGEHMGRSGRKKHGGGGPRAQCSRNCRRATTSGEPRSRD